MASIRREIALEALAERVWDAVRDALLLVSLRANREFAMGRVAHAAALIEGALATGIALPFTHDCAIEIFYNLACFRLVLGEIDAAATAARGAMERVRGRGDLVPYMALGHFAAVAAIGRSRCWPPN